MKENIKSKSVGVVVINSENKALILRRNENEDSFPLYWEIPGGKVEAGESPFQASVREVEEEAGIVLKQTPDLLVPFEYETERGIVEQINYSVKLENTPKVVLSNEHASFAWVEAGELGEYKISPETKKVVLDALGEM